MFEKYIRYIEYSDIVDDNKQKLKSFLELLDSYLIQREENDFPEKQLINLSTEELKHIFEIARINPELQIEIWRWLPSEIVDNPENSSIFETVLDNKFGEYLQGIDRKTLVKTLNRSREEIGALDDSTGQVLYVNVSLLQQMNSPLLDNEMAKEAFSFEQLLEILSNKKTERTLEEILHNPNSIKILKSIGQDSQSWQAKLQYLMDLNFADRERIIDEFDFDGANLIQDELKRREEWFVSMERGYYEDDDYGTMDCYISPEYMLQAIFGITYDEAKDLIKKYGTDIDKLNIRSEDEQRIQRKLQIIRELTNPGTFESVDELEDYYYSHKEEFLEISREVSAFYRVDLEKSFLDLYARQYDRALGVETTRLENMSYNGKHIPVYEASGDFTLLIRGEQNVSPENAQNFWESTQIQVKGLPQSTIAQDYIRTVNYDSDDICFVALTSCKDGELRMASTTNIKSKEANIALSNLEVKSDYGNGVILRIPQEQINNSRGTNNETDTTRNVYNSETGLYERKASDWVVYIQETNDVDISQDPRFRTAQFVASQTGWPILVIPREKCVQREIVKIQELKDKLLGDAERLPDETDESIIRELIVKFNNNREGILTSKSLKGKYFTEGEHIELVGVINARLSQVKASNPEQYDSLVQAVSEIYKSEIEKYYAFSYDRDDAQKELDIDATREHLKPYEDFLLAYERNIFDLSTDEKNNIYDVMRNISQTTYYDMNEYHSLDHIRRVVMFSGILAKNENLSDEETKILLAAASFHDSRREGSEGEDDNHAIASARQVKEYFEDNPQNPFGITSENLSIIQAVIEYHEHKETEKGVIDREKLMYLRSKYNIGFEALDSLMKISGLLKDADALDRARFGKKSENRWSLDARFLKSDTAKSVSMLRFSEECNFEFKERQTQKSEENSVVLSENEVEEIFENELNEFNRPKIQMSSLKQRAEGITVTQKKTLMDVLKNIRTTVKKFIEEFNR